MVLNMEDVNKRRSDKLKGRIKPPVVGINDFKTTHPSIAKKWHLTLNGVLKSTNVSHGSIFECWWRHYHRKTKSWHTNATTRSDFPLLAQFDTSPEFPAKLIELLEL